MEIETGKRKIKTNKTKTGKMKGRTGSNQMEAGKRKAKAGERGTSVDQSVSHKLERPTAGKNLDRYEIRLPKTKQSPLTSSEPAESSSISELPSSKQASGKRLSKSVSDWAKKTLIGRFRLTELNGNQS